MRRLAAAAAALRPDPAARRLLPGRAPWLLGAIAAVLLAAAVLALGAALAAGRAAAEWTGVVPDTATLSIIAEEAELEGQARAALAILRETPGVERVRVLDPAEQRALIAPWIGTGIAFDGVEMPLMIAVEADRRLLDADALGARLIEEAPGAVYDDHAAWRLPHLEAARHRQALAAGGALLLLGALAASAALAARAVVAAAGPAVATLARVGMSRGMITRLVLDRLLVPLGLGGLAGAVAGLVLAARLGEPDGAAGFAGWGLALPPLALLLGLALAAVAAALATRRALREAS